MSYQVIARKWRPQTFTDVVGQNHITQTLSNALKNGRIHHALLFTGPRGTGKTSSARILAKALRCPNAVDFVPCNVCPSCLEIAAGRSLDVQELDAASNNSVDDVRKLLEGVMSAPSSGRWKIYIIDEVHMLSTSAFNALLKTLEEPPAHVLFIMATTEVHKIPDTILSRCQRFDFKRIPTRAIMEHLKVIVERENVKADDEALWLIARQGDGSMRDSQSLLDQIITFSNGALTQDVVTRILGLTDRALLFESLQHLLVRDVHGMLKVIEKISVAGFEPRLFAQDMLETIRSLLLVKVSGSTITEILDQPDSELKFLAEIAAQMTEEEIHLLFDMTLKGANDIPKSQDPRIVLEMLLLRMAAAPRIQSLQDLLKALPVASPTDAAVMAPPPQPRRELRPPVSAPSPQAPVKTAGPLPAKSSFPRPANPVAPSISAASASATPIATPAAGATPMSKGPAAKAQGESPQDRWLSFVDLVRQEEALFAAKIENLVFSGTEGKVLKLSIPPKLAFLKEQMGHQEIRLKMKAYLDRFWGEGFSFEIVASKETPAGASATQMANQKKQLVDDEIRARVVEHPLVKAAQAALGSEIKSITPLKGATP